MRKRQAIVNHIQLCYEDQAKIKNNIMTSLDEELIVLLDRRIAELQEELAHMDAAERVRLTKYGS